MQPWETARKRFWTFVNRGASDEDCWTWKGSIHKNTGYGKFSMGHQAKQYAHRISVLLSGRSIPEGMIVHHTCLNRKCVNPNHLVVASYTHNNMAENRSGKFYNPSSGLQLSLLPDNE